MTGRPSCGKNAAPPPEPVEWRPGVSIPLRSYGGRLDDMLAEDASIRERYRRQRAGD